jgi:hypothetical protein
MDPATRRLVFIAAGLGGALLVLIGAWSMSGGGGAAGGIPVIAPPAGPLRVKPANPGGMKVTGADQSIFDPSHNGRDADAGKPMPAPERPDLLALRGPAAPGGTTPGAAGPNQGATASAPASPALPLPPAFQPPTSGVSLIAAPAPGPAASGRARSVAASPAAPGQPTRSELGRSQPGQAPSPAAASGGTQVQLAALQSRAAAEAEWRALRRRFPGVLAGHRLILAHATVGGREWWRVRTGGFAGAAQAHRFCASLRAGGAACDVTPF